MYEVLIDSAYISSLEPAAVIRRGFAHRQDAGKLKGIRNDGLYLMFGVYKLVGASHGYLAWVCLSERRCSLRDPELTEYV